MPGTAEPRVATSLTHDVFVSHSAMDKVVADAVVAHLEAAGIRCWVAPRDVLPGRIWSEEIVHAIQSSRVMVLILSGNANNSHQVLREVDHAATHGLVIMPFRTEPIELAAGLSYYLASEHWLDAITPPLEAHIDRLVTAVRQVLGVAEDAPSVAQPSAPPPIAPLPAAAPSTSRAMVLGIAAAVVLASLIVALVVVLGGGKKNAHAPGAAGTNSPTTSVTQTQTPSQTETSTSPTPSDTTDLAIAKLGCQLVAREDVKAVIGYDPGAGTPDGSTGFCSYGVDFPDVWIEQQGATRPQYDALRHDAAPGTVDVPGVGGGAYLEPGSGTLTIVVLDTKRAIIFELLTVRTDATSRQQLVDIARRTVARG